MDDYIAAERHSTLKQCAEYKIQHWNHHSNVSRETYFFKNIRNYCVFACFKGEFELFLIFCIFFCMFIIHFDINALALCFYEK